MLAWGVVGTLMGVSQSFGGFLAARFFLGVTESGLFPGVVFYLSMWYKRTESHYRVALFFSAASLAGAFGGILAYGIGFMGNANKGKGVGDYHGWRWIFILVSFSQCSISTLKVSQLVRHPIWEASKLICHRKDS
jgi:MFS family permease